MTTFEPEVLSVPAIAADVPPRDLAPIVDDTTMLVTGLVLCLLLVAFVYWRRSRTGSGGDSAPGN